MWRNTLPLPLRTPPQFYDMEVFNRCVQTRNPLMSLECWGEVHPALVTLPVDWPFTIPYGILYPLHPDPDTLRFLSLVRQEMAERRTSPREKLRRLDKLGLSCYFVCTIVLIFAAKEEEPAMTAPPRQTMLATAPVSKLIWTFAIPAILSQVVNSMHNIVDQTFLGWGIGDLAIAATNIAFPLSTLTTALAALIGMGGAAGFSLDLGKKQARSARKNWGNAIVLSVGLGCLLAVLAVAFWSRCSTSSAPQRP